MDNLKILIPLGEYYPAQNGGPSNSVYWHVNGLQNNDISCVVITTNSGLKESHGIKFNTWEKTTKGLIRYQKTLLHYFPLRAFLIQLKILKHIDIIHLNNIFYPLSFATALFINLTSRKPIVWSTRGELDPEALIYSTWKKKIVLYLLRRLDLLKISFHSTCDLETKYIQDNFGIKAKIIQIPNFILLPEYLGLKKQKQLLYIGRIHQKKAIENLINGLYISKKFMSSDYKLVIAGDNKNEYGDQLKKLTKERGLENKIDFVGHVEGEKKQNLLSMSYFSFMPSHTENFGNVVVEALAQGTPVVASYGTPWKILESENAGFWVSNKSDSLAHIIDRIIDIQENEYEIYRNNARKLASSFDVNSQIFRWINSYNEVIKI